MLKLIRNEYAKVFLKKSTYVIIIICLLLAVGISALIQYENDYSEEYYYHESTFSEELQYYNDGDFYSRQIIERLNIYINLGYEYYSELPEWVSRATVEYIKHYSYVLLSTCSESEREEIESYGDYILEDVDLEYEKKVTASMKEALETGDFKEWCKVSVEHYEYLKANNFPYVAADYEYYKCALEMDIDPEADKEKLNTLNIYINAKVEYDEAVALQESGMQVSDYELEKKKEVYTVYKCIVDNNIEIYKTEDLGIDEYYVNDNKLVESLISNTVVASMAGIFVMIVAAGIVANEFSSGTIKFLLINPVKRAKIFWSKYLTCISLLIGTLVVFFAVHFVSCIIICGTEGLDAVFISYSDGVATTQSIILYSIKQYVLSGVSLVTSVTLAFTISSLMKSNAVAIAVSVIVELIGSTVTAFLCALGHDWARYFIFANTDLASISNGNSMFPGQTLSFSLCTIVIYMVIYLLTAYDGFTKREV